MFKETNSDSKKRRLSNSQDNFTRDIKIKSHIRTQSVLQPAKQNVDFFTKTIDISTELGMKKINENKSQSQKINKKIDKKLKKEKSKKVYQNLSKTENKSREESQGLLLDFKGGYIHLFLILNFCFIRISKCRTVN